MAGFDADQLAQIEALLRASETAIATTVYNDLKAVIDANHATEMAKIDELARTPATDPDVDAEDELLTDEEQDMADEAKRGKSPREKSAINNSLRKLETAREKHHRLVRQLEEPDLPRDRKRTLRQQVEDAQDAAEMAENNFLELVNPSQKRAFKDLFFRKDK